MNIVRAREDLLCSGVDNTYIYIMLATVYREPKTQNKKKIHLGTATTYRPCQATTSKGV
jgi:hypothetical protein